MYQAVKVALTLLCVLTGAELGFGVRGDPEWGEAVAGHSQQEISTSVCALLGF